jgi:ABC-type Zn uptake system ZnuABC Zn-binding protein ZnuA
MFRFFHPAVALATVMLLVAPLIPGQAVVAAPGANLNVVATTTFLADMAQNVAGSRITVHSLIPIGVDPHGFQPTPADIRAIADSNVLITNGFDLEGHNVEAMLLNAGGNRLLIEAAAGLTPRQTEDEDNHHQSEAHGHDAHEHESDPHFWLDPNLAIKYVENIRDGLSQADPDGAAIYTANANAYIAQLRGLDAWISDQVNQIPAERRLLVTNHESFGYFADRYGFRVVGAIIPNVSTGASPSAKDLAALVEKIKGTGAPAIFLETGTNPQVADQVAREAGVKLEIGLYSHSVTGPGGPAPTYIDMIKYNTNAIVNALQ